MDLVSQMFLLNFIKNHKNWEELLTNPPYCLKVSRDNGYILFKYNQEKSDFLKPEVRESRGIIFREKDFKIVCHPFDKFGNYGESFCPNIKWSSASVQEKIDGSLMKVWYDNVWHISTNGTIDAFKSFTDFEKNKSFGSLFLMALPIDFNLFTSVLNKEYTYMFELVSPYNRVVIEYKNTELYYLGARNNISQEEYMPEDTDLYNYKWFKLPRRFDLHKLEDVKKAADLLPWNEEGYVVCDNDFNRVKIKSPEYVRAHYARHSKEMSYERLLDVIRDGEENEFLLYAPEYEEDLNYIKNTYFNMKEKIKIARQKIRIDMYPSRKEFALEVLKMPRWMQGFLFDYKQLDEIINNVTTKKWVDLMKEGGFLNKLYVMVGLPASGKSTYAKQLGIEKNAVIVSSDDIRKELNGSEEDQSHNSEVFALVRERIRVFLAQGKNVIYDATNVSSKKRKSFLKSLGDLHFGAVAYYFSTPIDECKKRNLLRERHVPNYVIERMYENLTVPSVGEGFLNVVVVYPNN